MSNPDFTPIPTSPPLPSSTSNRRLTPSASASSPLNPYADRNSHGPVTRAGSSGSSSEEAAILPRSRNSSSALSHNRRDSQLDAASFGVLTGAVGGSFGPFPRSSTYSNWGGGQAPFNRRDSIASSDVAIDLGQDVPSIAYNRYSTASASDGSFGGAFGPDGAALDSSMTHAQRRGEPNTALLWDKENAEADDYLHDPDPEIDRMLDKQWANWSGRGWLNGGSLILLIVVLVGLFAGWPIYRFAILGGFPGTSESLGWNLGGINGSGQVPDTGLPSLIDVDTPASVRSRIGFDGETYNLVFSDEFNTDGRTFWPGDDPFWEAVDLHYWATTDLEWYDPDAVTTKNGALEILMTEEPINGLNFRSGMIQSWNKFCFTGGYIEVSMSMPGNAQVQGYWPGAWTISNLVRAGYGATADGMWPYSYNSCDVGTLPNQTWPNGTDPIAAKESGSRDYGGELSYLGGQRVSACTCPGEDHPGPRNNIGRGGAEIDINEAQVDYRGVGSASQSIQVAPMTAGYAWKNETPYIRVWDDTITFQNTWHGSVNQESMSVITLTDATSFDGRGYTNYGFEYDPGADGRITWAMNQTETWQLNASAMGPDEATQIGQRIVSEEPMAINLNLAISTKFQPPNWEKMNFPGTLRIDYVRVWQKGKPNVGCDPEDRPTSDYINRHMDAYTNANFTTWDQVSTWPKNRLSAEGC